MRVRPARPEDLVRVQAIYAHHVKHGLGTFEEVPPTIEELRQRYEAVRARGLPWLAADVDGEVRGYAYAGPFRPRAAYRYTVEDSVYVAPEAQGRGIGKALLGAVIEECERLGLRQMAAVIGDSGNVASIGLHRACGFELKAVLPGLGFKFDRWVDVVWMQRALGPGDGRGPEAPGLELRGA
jgi:phosphinothricin acetyltransferase